MKNLFLLLFIPFVCFGHEDIERYKVYKTTNIYTSLLLDSATGQIWQLQIGLPDVDRLKSVLSDTKLAKTLADYTQKQNEDMEFWEENFNSKADSIFSVKKKKYFKPDSLENKLNDGYYYPIAKNGRFKLYPTDNSYNFIMVDTINGKTYQVQWNIDKDKRFVIRFY
jgi:hypothetical protein|tara:strand:- start:36 stop:536 length:501 start_codon:yes stop_codon:yes gene_type:complete